MPLPEAFKVRGHKNEMSAEILASCQDSQNSRTQETDHLEPMEEPQTKEVRISKPPKRKPAESSRPFSISNMSPPASLHHGNGSARGFIAPRWAILTGGVTCDFTTGDPSPNTVKTQWGLQQPAPRRTSGSDVKNSHQLCLVPDAAVIEVLEWLYSDEISRHMRPVCPLWCQVVDADMRRRLELFCKGIWKAASKIMSLMQIPWGRTLVFSCTDPDLTLSFIFNCIGFKIWIAQPSGLMINASFRMELDQSTDKMIFFGDGSCPEGKPFKMPYSTLWPEISTLMHQTLVPEVKKWRPPPLIAQEPERRSVFCQSHCFWVEVPCISVPSQLPSGQAAHSNNAKSAIRRGIKMTLKVSDAKWWIPNL